MLKILTNITKAAIAVAATPITLVVDTLMLPVDAEESGKSAYSRTGGLLSEAKKNLDKAVSSDD